MKNFKLLLVASIISLSLVSCKKSICVRCENGLTGDITTKCFTDKEERQQFIDSRQALGYSCIGQ